MVYAPLLEGFNDMAADYGQLPALDIGKIVLVNLSSFKEGQKARVPAIIWGIYRNRDGHIQGLDVMTIRGANPEKKTFVDNLNLFKPEEYESLGRNFPVRISTASVTTVPYRPGYKNCLVYVPDNEDATARHILPDILARRVVTLTVEPKISWEVASDFRHEDGWTREGLQTLIQPYQVKAGAFMAPEMSRYWRHVPSPLLSQDDVAGINRYALRTDSEAHNQDILTQLPDPGQDPQSWPNWESWSQVRGKAASQKTSCRLLNPGLK